MLLIEIYSREELVKYFQKNEGTLEENSYLITISAPDKQVIINNKSSIFSKKLFVKDINFDETKKILSFITNIIMPDVFLWFDKDFKLILHSDDINIAAGIAIFLITEYAEKFVAFKGLPLKTVDNIYFIIFEKLEVVNKLFKVFNFTFN